MDADFWLARWREGRIGFHQPDGHPTLRAHIAKLGPARGKRVLVPLCGKTHDLRVLADAGFAVTGVEFAGAAAEAFFAEHGLTPSITEPTPESPFRAYASGGVTILVGDFFALDPARAGAFDAVYDRAALIALPPELRERYAHHVLALLAPARPMLLVTLEYDQSALVGPPFSVPDAEVRARYAAGCEIEKLASREDEVVTARLGALASTARAIETDWVLTRR